MAHSLPLDLKDLEIRTIWIMSARHIKAAELKRDFGEYAEPIVQSRNWYRINLLVNPDVTCIQDTNYAPHIKTIMLEANRLGVTEVRFDKVAEVLECFAQFGDLE